MKKIVVACGTGMATSTLISERIRNILDDANIEYNITQCILSEVKSKAEQADLVITSMKVNEDCGVPMLVGTPFLTGIGEEEAKEKVLEILSK